MWVLKEKGVAEGLVSTEETGVEQSLILEWFWLQCWINTNEANRKLKAFKIINYLKIIPLSMTDTHTKPQPFSPNW